MTFVCTPERQPHMLPSTIEQCVCGIVRIQTWYLSALTLHTAVVGTVRSLLCPGRHGRQRYTYSKNINFGRGRNTLSIAMKLRVNVFYNVQKTYWVVCVVVPPWSPCLFTHPLEEIKLDEEHGTICAIGRHKSYIQGVPGGMCQTSGECSLC